MSNPEDRIARALSDRYEIERELGQGGMATVYQLIWVQNWFEELKAKVGR